MCKNRLTLSFYSVRSAVALFIVQFGVFSIHAVCADAATPEIIPNIVIVQSDNMGWADICANSSQVLTQNANLCNPTVPNTGTLKIDSLAKSGVSMTNFHAATPSCSPSRASLLTGMHARRHGVSNKNTTLNASENLPTLAKILQNKDLKYHSFAQYNTLFVGKWHLGNTSSTLPESRGFDYYYVSPTGSEQHGLCFREKGPGETVNSDTYYITHGYLAADDKIKAPCTNSGENWWDFVSQNADGPIKGRAGELMTKSMSEVLTDKTIAYIDSLYTSLDRSNYSSKPLFLYLNYTAVHGPLDIDIPDVPVYYNDGIANNGSDIISYQQYKARTGGMTDLYDGWFDPNMTGFRTLSGYSIKGQKFDFNVGNYIYAGTSWTAAWARGKITKVETSGTRVIITYQLVSTTDSIQDFIAGDVITEYTGTVNDSKCTAANPVNAVNTRAPSYYNQAIKEVDNGLGRILDKISTLGGEGDTIVVFLSDNGAYMGAQLEFINTSMNRDSNGGLRGGYPYLYEGGSRIPFIAKWPNGGWGADGNTTSAVFSEQLADVTDIMPTLLKAAGMKMPNTPIDGIDLTPVLHTSTGSDRVKKDLQYYLFDARRYYTTSDTPALVDSFPYAIQSYDPSNADGTNYFKLFLDYDYSRREGEFYNLKNDPNDPLADPAELTPLALNSDIVDPLTSKSTDFLDSIGYATQFFFPFKGYGASLNNDIDVENTKLFVRARNLNDYMNIKFMFYDVNGSLVGFKSFGLAQNHYFLDSIDDLCGGIADIFIQPVPSCQGIGAHHFEGTMAVFTDKPAYVSLSKDQSDKLTVISPAEPVEYDTATLSYRVVFPKVYEISAAPPAYTYTKNLVIWNNGNHPNNITINWLSNTGGLQSPPTPITPNPKPLLPYEKYEIRPSSYGITSGMIEVKGTNHFVATMKSEINNLTEENAAYYQVSGKRQYLYFPWVKDGITNTSMSLAMLNELATAKDVDVKLYTYNPADYTQPPLNTSVSKTVSVPVGKKELLPSSAELFNAPFEGAMVVSGLVSDKYRALADVTVKDDSDNIQGHDIFRPAVPNRVLIFPKVNDNYNEHSSLVIMNVSDKHEDIEITLFNGAVDIALDKDGRTYTTSSSIPYQYKGVPPKGRVVFRPSEKIQYFSGTVRVTAKTIPDDPNDNLLIAGVVYSEKTGLNSPIAINVQESTLVEPSVARNLGPHSVCAGGETVKIQVFKDEGHVFSGDSGGTVVYGGNIKAAYDLVNDHPAGAVINRGNYIEYTPPSSNFLGPYPHSDVLHYTIQTEEGIEVGPATITLSVNQCLSVKSLTVTKTGPGTGTVTSSPSGIDCGVSCSVNFSLNSSVALSATPSPDSVFAGWSGAADCSDGVVTMDADKTCTATFSRLPDLLPTAINAVKSGTTKILVSDTVQCQGGSSPVSTTIGYYLSTNTTYEPGTDLALASSSKGSGTCMRTVTSLQPGNSNSFSSLACYKPRNAVTGTNYYVIVVDDINNQVIELSETNNTMATSGTINW